MPPYELSTLAESDLDGILQYTFDNFGGTQMLKYNDQIAACFDEMSKSSGLYKTIKRKGKKMRSLHCQKHYIFAMERKGRPLLILAIFHERMDLMNRLKGRL